MKPVLCRNHGVVRLQECSAQSCFPLQQPLPLVVLQYGLVEENWLLFEKLPDNACYLWNICRNKHMSVFDLWSTDQTDHQSYSQLMPRPNWPIMWKYFALQCGLYSIVIHLTGSLIPWSYDPMVRQPINPTVLWPYTYWRQSDDHKVVPHRPSVKLSCCMIFFIPESHYPQTHINPCVFSVTSVFIPLQAMCDLMVEVVFPTCAIFLLADERMRKNKVALSALASGEIYQSNTSDAFQLIAGSRAEGLTMHGQWGHPWPDYDAMALNGKEVGVKIPHGQLGTKYQPIENMLHSSQSQGCHSNSCLEYMPEGCPPGYTRLLVTDVQTFMEGSPTVDLSDCVEERDGHNWLNTARLNRVAMWNFNKNNPTTQTTGISGPAGQVI